MLRFFVPALLIVIAAVMPLCAQTPGWTGITQLQTGFQTAFPKDAVADVYGNLYLCCTVHRNSFIGYPEYPPQNYDGYCNILYKQDIDGNILWISPFDEIYVNPRFLGTDGAGCLYYTANFVGTVTLGGFTVGNGQGGRLIAKMDGAGNYLWVRDITGCGMEADFSVGLDGSCFVAGTFDDDPLTFGDITLTCTGYDDMYVARMNSSGDWVWARQATGWREVGGKHVAAGAGGECYVSGRAYSDLDLGEFQLDRPNNDYNWIFIAKYSAGGVCLWAGRLYRPLYYEYSLNEHDLLWDGGYNALLLYTFGGDDINTSMRIRQFGPGGTSMDVYTTGTSGTVGGRSFTRDAAGNLYLLGYYEEPFTLGGSSFSADKGTVLMKVYSNFSQAWAYDPSPGYYSNYRQIRSDPNGRCYLTLSTFDTMPVGPYQTSPSMSTFSVIGTQTNGDIAWIRSSWLNHIGSEGTDVCQDRDGNSWLSGNYEGGFIHADSVYTSFGVTGTDIYAARLGENGDWLWIGTAGGTGEDRAAALATDGSQCSYLTGSFENTAVFGSQALSSQGGTDAFVAKLDGQGNWLWAVSFGGLGADAGKDIVSDNQGNLYVTGTFSGSVDFGAQTLTSHGGTDIFVLKLNPSGLPLAAVRGGGDAEDTAGGLNILPNGDLALCAGFRSNALFGERPFISQGESDILVARLDTSLHWEEVLSVGWIYEDCPTGISSDASGCIYIAGYFTGCVYFDSHYIVSEEDKDAFVAKFSPQGSWLWARSCGSVGEDKALAIATDLNGTSYITGYARGDLYYGGNYAQIHSAQDILTAALDNSGNWLWAKLNGLNYFEPGYDAGEFRGSGIAVSGQGRCIVTGLFSNWTIFANDHYEPLGAYETFLGTLQDGVGVSDPSQIPSAELDLKACPNPFSGEVGLILELDRPGPATLKIYNLRGVLVRTLFAGEAHKGPQNISWDGRDDAGRDCPTGIYLLKGESANRRKNLKLIKY